MGWHSDSVEKVFEQLESSKEGLKTGKASERLDEYGENSIRSSDTVSPLNIFLGQFRDNLIYLLFAAAVVSVAIGFLPGHSPEYTEAGIIMIILFFNGFIGFIQDYRAEKSIQALKELASPDATIVRDGERMEVDSSEVVPGDVILLEQGDAVPADARVFYSESLHTDESALTGESVNVAKDTDKVDEEASVASRTNMVFMNTHVVKGRGKAVVTDTGMETEVGDIAQALDDADEKDTPFQEEVDRMGKRIGLLVTGIIAVVALFMAAFTGAGPVVILLMSVSLMVAAIPESLPAIVTLAMALGSRRMLEKNALVRRLPVVEALGSVNAIVTDKTGTLTEGVMTVEKISYNGKLYSVSGHGTSLNGVFRHNGEEVEASELKEVLECGYYCNNSEKAPESSEDDFIGEPTEIALKVSALKAGINDEKERLRSVPFSSDRKRMTVITEDRQAYMKGAPEKILDRCDRIRIDGETRKLTDEKKEEILETNTEFASEALRVLAFASKEVENVSEASDEEIENDMVFLGLQGMIDPEREEVREAVKDCRDAGIKVVMATGDNIETAKAIGEKLGFNSENAVAGPELEEMSDEELDDVLDEAEIFARVSPRHKVRILKTLQRKDMHVAMTGDGVNDAPALKNSDVGVAMGQRGTDVAKESSDMILQDDNFATIRDAIAEGRGIFDNIRKVVNYLLSTNSAEVMLVFIGTIIGGLFFPEVFSGADAVVLTAVMILWVNFATDVPPSLAMSMDKKLDNIMKRPPRGNEDPIIDRRILLSVAVIGPLAALVLLPGFFIYAESLVKAQTVLFNSLAFFEILMIQVVRDAYDLDFLDNEYLVAGVFAALLAQFVLIYGPLAEAFGVVPLTLFEIGVSAVSVAVFGLLAFVFYRGLDRVYGKRE